MNGIHDMGGMQDMGPIAVELNEPPFHHAWEARVHAMQAAMRRLGKWNIDMSRYSIERIPPARYLESSYYERWLLGLERLLVEKGVVTPEELASGKAAGTAPPPSAPATLQAADLPAVRAAFEPGDAVMARNFHPTGHTRLPRYVRGKRGVVDHSYGLFLLPDVHATTGEEVFQHLYAVRFSARELWGSDAQGGDTVTLDMWEGYIERPG